MINCCYHYILEEFERMMDNYGFSYGDILSFIGAFLFPILSYFFISSFQKIRRYDRVKKLSNRNLEFNYTDCIGLDHWSSENVDKGKDSGYFPLEFYQGYTPIKIEERFGLNTRDSFELTNFGKEQLNKLKIPRIESLFYKHREPNSDADKICFSISAVTRLRTNNNEQSGLRIRIYPIDLASKNSLLNVFKKLNDRNEIFRNNSVPKNIEELTQYFPFIHEFNLLYFLEDENENIYCKKNENGKLDFIKKIDISESLITNNLDLNHYHNEIGINFSKADGQDLVFFPNKFSLGIIFKINFRKKELTPIESNEETFNLKSILNKEIPLNKLEDAFQLAINCQLVKQNKIVNHG